MDYQRLYQETQIPSTPLQPQEVAVQKPPVNTTKKLQWLWWVIGGIALVGIGLASGLVAGKTLYAPKPTPSSAPVIHTSPTPSPDPTAGWKTYTDPRYGFSIRYPSDWQTLEKQNPVMQAPYYGSKTSDTVKIYTDNSYIQFYSGVFFEEKNPNFIIQNIEQVNISDRNGTKTTYLFSNQPRETTVIEIVFTDASPYRIQIVFPSVEREKIDQILETFRFMDDGLLTKEEAIEAVKKNYQEVRSPDLSKLVRQEFLDHRLCFLRNLHPQHMSFPC